jgi:hypothetical protein
MGLAEYGVGDSQVSFVTGLKTMLGKDALTRSAMAFARSAEVDPSFVRGLVDLANTALRQRVNIKLGVALDALRRSATTPAAHDPEVLLARGRVEREVVTGLALAAFRGYLIRPRPLSSRSPDPLPARPLTACSLATTAPPRRSRHGRGAAPTSPPRLRGVQVRRDGRAVGPICGGSGRNATAPARRQNAGEHHRLFYARKNSSSPRSATLRRRRGTIRQRTSTTAV